MDAGPTFGAFLRSRRARLTPAEVGLAPQPRRRIVGLRREEVAQLAGISTEWYVKLEQGRAVAPSAATIEALGSALRLDPLERAHLRSLAARAAQPAFVRETVPDSLRRLIEGLTQPAYVTGQRWDVLAWNAGAVDLLGDFGRVPEEDRNILWFMLGTERARRLFGAGWAAEARRMVSMFRTTHDLWPADPAFGALTARLRAACPEFAGWWTSHEIGTPSSGSKTVHHPKRGTLVLDYATFQANDDPALKLAIYTPR
ncbi:MAG: helix-turn-helix domain-containing protein [Rhodospirillales bacterium]|nr:helix-turn-helix domain-containing protein [Rhodospirillales bacterium]MBN8898560.1 helix-turn-helix domain-containing protein [Rhodospirillales bacterium]